MPQKLSHRLQKYNYILLFASLSCILVATLHPFKFVIPQGFSSSFIIEEFNFGSSIKDYWQNILLFIPLGISLFIITAKLGHNVGLCLIVCCLISAVVSGTVELTQLFLPTRVSNLTDLICNSLGGGVGGILSYWHRNITRFLIGILTANQSLLTWKSLLTAIAIYYSLIVLATSILLFNINLSNWDDNYRLTVGNEVTGDRPWHGYINSLYICDRALNHSQIQQVFDNSQTFFSQLPSSATVIALFEPQKIDGDQNIAELEWQTKLASPAKKYTPAKPENQDLGVLLGKKWLRTKEPQIKLNQQLKKAGEFSLFLTIASRDLTQRGPARIMSLADGIYSQNLMLGQQGTSLNFRLRTPITGNNPTNPTFSIPNVFDDYDFHRLLIVFANRQLNFYLDCDRQASLTDSSYPSGDRVYSYKFNVYNSFGSYLPWNRQEQIVNLAEFNRFKYSRLFYTVVLFPLTLPVYYLILKAKS